MVNRPFEDERPFGPFIDLGLGEVRHSEKKQTIGITGTTRPYERKGRLSVLYILDRHEPFLPREINSDRFHQKVNEEVDGVVKMSVKRSGQLRRFGINSQAVVAHFGGSTTEVGARNSLPVQDGTIHRIGEIVQEHFDDELDSEIPIKAIVYDTD
jgi:hypothetical protein